MGKKVITSVVIVIILISSSAFIYNKTSNKGNDFIEIETIVDVENVEYIEVGDDGITITSEEQEQITSDTLNRGNIN